MLLRTSSTSRRYFCLFASTMIVFLACLIISLEAFATTSIKYGWIALDSSKNMVLQGSQYSLSGQVKPITAISNGRTVKSVNKNSVVYLNNTKKGTAQALIIGDKIPGCKDAFITTFNIVNTIDISKASIEPISTQTYTGNSIEPAVNVKYGNKKLKKGVDYTLEYSNGIKVGTATATIKGIGNYTGKNSVTYKIASVAISKANISKISSQKATGKKIKPKFNVTYKGKTLKQNIDYSVSYSNNVKIGKATITINGKGNFKGKTNVNFTIEARGADLARTACLLAYSRPATYGSNGNGWLHGSKYAGTKAQKRATKKAGEATGRMLRHCSAAIGVVIKTSGYNKSFPCTHAVTVHKNLANGTNGTKGKWKYVGTYKELAAAGKLQPGDLASSSSHLCMYVGTSIPNEIYKKYLKDTDADVGTPLKGSAWVSAHWGAYGSSALCIGTKKYSGVSNSFKIYRCTGTPPKFTGKIAT